MGLRDLAESLHQRDPSPVRVETVGAGERVRRAARPAELRSDEWKVGIGAGGSLLSHGGLRS